MALVLVAGTILRGNEGSQQYACGIDMLGSDLGNFFCGGESPYRKEMMQEGGMVEEGSSTKQGSSHKSE